MLLSLVTFLQCVHRKLEEELEPDLRWSMQVSKVLHEGQSEFQQVALVETPRFGKVNLSRLADFRVLMERGRYISWCSCSAWRLVLQLLLLDGKTQSAEFDEAVYHEMLVHPSMLLHPNPKTVFIAGGT